MPKLDNLPSRKITRISTFDYAHAGGYFVTTCTHERRCLFGEVRDGEIALNDLGKIVQEAWDDLPNHHPRVHIGEFVVMPNHIHGIIYLVEEHGLHSADMAGHVPTRRFGKPISGTLSAIIGSLKSRVTRKIRAMIGKPIIIWQDRFHEHVIRDDADLYNHRRYIIENPANWERDKHNPNFMDEQGDKIE